MRNQSTICLVFFLLTSFGVASAASNSSAYARDSSGSTVRSTNGLCWRTGYWAPGDAVTGCDGDLAPPVGKSTAPALLSTPSEAVEVLPLAIPAVKRCDFRLTLDSDSTFGFGKDQLSEFAKKRLLAEFQQKVRTCGTINSIHVNAYTDRLGEETRNQRLSQRRAASISAIIAGGAISSPIEARGLGSTQSVSQCEPHLKKNALIRCLAPDRRATIEVQGLAR